MAKRKTVLNTAKALAALDETTTTGEITSENHRAIKELINACDDLNRVFHRNGVTSMCELEYRFFELANLKKRQSCGKGEI